MAKISFKKSMLSILFSFSVGLSLSAVAEVSPRGPVVCVQKCEWRSLSDGSCLQFGEDFCGHDAQCSVNCTWRSASGQCLNVGADYCGENATCTLNCTWRNASGECLSYGPDRCESASAEVDLLDRKPPMGHSGTGQGNI